MLIKIYQVAKEYFRTSKQGKLHKYVRRHSIALLSCDCCREEFERRVRQIDPRRLSDEHVHVCPNCPGKNFAQKKSVESRKFWNTTVDKDINL